MAADPPNIDPSQTLRLFRALYQKDDWFHLFVYTEKGMAPEQYDPWIADRMRKRSGSFKFPAKMDSQFDAAGFTYFVDPTLQEMYLLEPLLMWNRRKMAVAMSVPVYGYGKRRRSSESVGLSAFGLDVDQKDFEALVPGAKTVEEIVPEVLQRFEKRGIRPHALVHSGNGLHVYILIERHLLRAPEERDRVVAVWGQLCDVLGGARDRHDLASVLRVPGTINWKNNSPKLVHFIEEHTDLTRARYSFEQVAAAVADVPSQKSSKKPPRKIRPTGSGAHITDEHRSELPAWSRHILDIALKLDPGMAKKRAASLEGSAGDRSRADFAYAVQLVKLGFSQAEIEVEIAQSSKGRECSIEYSSSTTLKAAAQTLSLDNTVKSTTFALFKDSGVALYTIIEAGWKKETPTDVTTSAAPKLGIVLARAGDGKTRNAIHELAQRVSLDIGRLGFCSLFVPEIMRHEYRMNTSWPAGLWLENETSEGVICVPIVTLANADPPETHDELWRLLGEDVRTQRDTKDKMVWAEVRADGSLAPSKKFIKTITNPGIFWLNSRHPRYADQSRYIEDEDGQIQDWAFEASPRAVAKFGARSDLCLAGHENPALRSPHPPCGSCSFSSCRSNANPEVGGSKLDWGKARFALLTHSGYRINGLHNPKLNEFKAVIFDELPAQIYRLPTVEIRQPAKSSEWSVFPLSDLILFLQDGAAKLAEAIAALDESEATDERKGALMRTLELIETLNRARKKLVRVASKHKSAAAKGDHATSFKFYRLETTFEPLLNSQEFKDLLNACKRLRAVPYDGVDDTDQAGDGDFDASQALMLLADFSGDEPFAVYEEHDFSKDNRRAHHLWIRRPVNGWPDVLNNNEGTARPTVILDASAGIDPRYLLLGGGVDEAYPSADFPNTTVVLTHAGTLSKKKMREAVERSAIAFAEQIAKDLRTHMGEFKNELASPKLLVVTEKEESRIELEPQIQLLVERGLLPRITTVVHFGSLRGKNDYDDYDAVYFTHLHRYGESDYIGLALLLSGFQHMPKQWEFSTIFKQGMKKNGKLVKKQNPLWRMAECLRYRWMTCDIYQDAMRIGIRRDPMRQAFIFLPTTEIEFVARIMRLFRGAKLITPTGEKLVGPSYDDELDDYTFEEDYDSDS